MKLENIKNSKKLTVTISSVVIAAVLLVPTLYSLVFLGSIWNVYNRLDTLPVAFVNLDKSVTKNGKKYALGKDIEKGLKNNRKVAWNFVSSRDAIDGVNGNKYYAVIEIPENFSKNMSDTLDGKFNKPEIIYICNQGKNYVFSQVSSKLADSVKTEISSNIQKEVSKALVNSLYDVKASIKNAGDGAEKLQSGTEKLVSGSTDLSNGLSTAANGSKQIYTGLQTITNGQDKIVSSFPTMTDGLNTLKNSLTKSNDKVSQLANGASTLNDKTGEIAKGAGTLDTSIGTLTDNIKKLDLVLHNELSAIDSSNLSPTDKFTLEKAITALDTMSGTNTNDNNTAPLTKATASVHQLSLSIKQLNGGTQQISEGVSALSSGLNDTQKQAAAGLDKLIAGAGSLQSGSSTILTGLNTVTDKTGLLADGLDKLSNGSISLANGIQTANDGTVQLKNGLNEGLDKMNNNLKFNSDNMSQFVSKPVALKDESINTVQYYGQGLAPYMMSVSMWLGSFVLIIVFSITKALNIFKSKLMNSFIGKYLLGLGIVILQSSIISFAVISILNMNPINVPEFYIMNAFISITFFSFMYGISYAIGILAGPVMFVILILQLGSSGGTFPIETAPVFYNILSKIVPMPYAVSTLRMTISGINQTVLNYNIQIMLIFIAAALIIGFLLGTLIDNIKIKKQPINNAKAA